MTTLKRGSTGPEVTALQERLLHLGFDPNGVDGNFGPGTESAVKAFQQSKGLSVDGKVGPNTRAALGMSSSTAPLNFIGKGLPLDQTGFSEAIGRMTVGAPELWAVLKIEARGWGFLPDRRPVILFERHQFSERTNHQFDGSHPDISNQVGGGYGASGAHQYDRLQRAISLNRTAALQSVSWGLGQIMGFNAQAAGYSNVEGLVAAMIQSENEQLRGMASFILSGDLHHPLREHRWADFARKYNGAGYAAHNYHGRLAEAYQRFAQGPRPDLNVRAAQVYLTYLGFNPGPVDGWVGTSTYGALNSFQQQNGLPVNNEINEATVEQLKAKALPET